MHSACYEWVQRRRQENSSGGPSRLSLGGRPTPSLPSPLSLPSSFPFSSSSLLFPHSILLSSLPLPLRSRPLKSSWGSGGALGESQPTNYLVHFRFKIGHLVTTILIISSVVKRLLWRASPLARGPDFIQGARPPWPSHWRRRWVSLSRSVYLSTRLVSHALTVQDIEIFSAPYDITMSLVSWDQISQSSIYGFTPNKYV